MLSPRLSIIHIQTQVRWILTRSLVLIDCIYSLIVNKLEVANVKKNTTSKSTADFLSLSDYIVCKGFVLAVIIKFPKEIKLN